MAGGSGRFGKSCSIISPAFASPATSTPCRKGPCSSRTSRSCASRRRLPEAQLVETRLINLLHFQTLIAAKAARMVLAAPGKLLVDFGLRRAHGAEAGCSPPAPATSPVLPAPPPCWPRSASGSRSSARWRIPSSRPTTTRRAFEEFARSRPDNLTLLIDTYDTEAAARKVVALAPRLKRPASGPRGAPRQRRSHRVVQERPPHPRRRRAARVRSSPAAVSTRRAREYHPSGAPIDGFGIGTSLTTSSDAPALDCAYKLQEYAGLPRRKRSDGKATWPGRKQVWRRYRPDGRMAGDILSMESDPQPGEPLIQPVMRAGRGSARHRRSRDPRARHPRSRAAAGTACVGSGRRDLTRSRWPAPWCGSRPTSTAAWRRMTRCRNEWKSCDRRSGSTVGRRYPERLLSGGPASRSPAAMRSCH